MVFDFVMLLLLDKISTLYNDNYNTAVNTGLPPPLIKLTGVDMRFSRLEDSKSHGRIRTHEKNNSVITLTICTYRLYKIQMSIPINQKKIFEIM